MNDVRPIAPHLVEQLVPGIGTGRQALFRQQHARLRGVPARRYRVTLSIDIERHARFLQRSADTAHVLGVEADVERLEVGPAQIIASEPNRREHGEANHSEASQTPRAQPQKIAPQPLKLFQPEHAKNPAPTNRLNADIPA